MTQRAIVVILDGLRRDWVTPALTPAIWDFATHATRYDRHQSVFPSCTRVVSSSVATGCLPARHGIQGNMLALTEGGRPVLHDVGPPGFFEHRRAVTGRAMERPTWAERLAGRGGSVVYSNVSPGAAYAQDPDGNGRVYHRAGSYGPGRIPIVGDHALNITPDTDGDAVMMDRFCHDMLDERQAALGVLWCGNPDTAQHKLVLGSPEHYAVLAEVDRNIGRLLGRIGMDDETLVVLASDHGHEAVCGTVDVVAALVDAGLKDSADSADVVVAPNGSACLIYLGPEAQPKRPAIADWLSTQHWAGQVFGADRLIELGLSDRDGLAFAVSMAAGDAPNAYGIPGSTLVAVKAQQTGPTLGTGTHGGIGDWAQAPFLMIRGSGFAPGNVVLDRTSAIDLAPTVLQHLGLPTTDMDGRPLQTDQFLPN